MSEPVYGWTTVSKIRGIMNRIFKIGIIHKKVTKNPVEGLTTSVKTTYKAIKITPAQTLLILRSVMGNMLHFTLVFEVAATALRSSEMLSLRRADIVWEERKIRIVKSWKTTGVDGSTKTPSSERDVPMGRVLAHYLHEWHKQTPYAKPTDFVFPLMRESGKYRSVRRYSAAFICVQQRRRPGLLSRTGIAGVYDTACRTGL